MNRLKIFLWSLVPAPKCWARSAEHHAREWYPEELLMLRIFYGIRRFSMPKYYILLLIVASLPNRSQKDTP